MGSFVRLVLGEPVSLQADVLSQPEPVGASRTALTTSRRRWIQRDVLVWSRPQRWTGLLLVPWLLKTENRAISTVYMADGWAVSTGTETQGNAAGETDIGGQSACRSLIIFPTPGLVWSTMLFLFYPGFSLPVYWFGFFSAFISCICQRELNKVTALCGAVVAEACLVEYANCHFALLTSFYVMRSNKIHKK